MPGEPIKVDFPFAGVHQGVAYEQQPPNTSQRIVNMRPRDWSVGGRRRGAVRPGLDRYCPVLVGSGAIRAMAPLPGSTAVLVEDAVLWLDGFGLPVTTTPGANDALGDRDGNGTDDYKVFISGTTSISTPLAGKSGAEDFFTFQDAFDLRTLPVTVPLEPERVAVAGRCVAMGFPSETVSGQSNAGTVRIYRWNDAGELELRATFIPIGSTLTQSLGYRVAADYVTASPDTIYVLASAPFEGGPGFANRGLIRVYRSTDGGLTWAEWATYTGQTAGDRIGHFTLEVDADHGWVAVSRWRATSNLVVRTLVAGSPGIGTTTAGSSSTSAVNRVAIRNNHLVSQAGGATAILWRWDGAAWNQVSTGSLQDTSATNLSADASWPAFNRSGSRLLLGRPTWDTNDGAVFVYLKSGTDIPIVADHRVDTPDDTLARTFGSRVSVHDDFGVTRQLKIGSATEYQCILMEWNSGTSEYETGQRIDTPTVSDAQEFGDLVLQMTSDDSVAISQYPISSEIRAIERWTAVSLAGAAPYVDVDGGEGRLQDALTGLAGWACLFADRGSPDPFGADPNDYANEQLILSIRCKTAPTLASRTGVIGLFAYGDETAMDANNGVDRASVILCSKLSSGQGFIVNGYVNNAGNMADFQKQAPAFEWQPNREYIIRATLNGKSAIVEVETDGTTTLLATCPDIRKSVSGDHTAAGKVATGFIFGSASLDEADTPLFAWVDDFRIATGKTQTQDFNTRVIAVGGPDLVVASSDGATVLSGGTGAVALNQTATLLYVPPLDQGQEGRVLIYDGQSYRQVDATSLTLTDRTATAGELPGTGTGETDRCRYAVVWQNSVMSWGRDTFPTNWYLSRVADPDDHLYIVANPDGLQAAAGDNTRMGLLPGPITCMIPATADVLVAATRESIFAFVGRPTLGGYLDDVSDLVGIVGPRAATRDDLGNIYFASLRGLYIMPAGSRVVEKISRGRMDSWFDSIDHSKEQVIVRWSDSEEGCHVFRVPASGPVEHLFWDRQDNAFVFDVYPDGFNPTSSILSVDAAGRPRVLVGGRDGFIRSLVPGKFDDSGQAISAEVFYPPIVGGSRRAILGAMSLRLGNDTDAAAWEIRSADGGESLVEAPIRYSGLAAVRRMNHIHRRVGGPVVGVALRNVQGSRLSVEDLVLHIEAGGLAGRDGQ